MKGNKYNPTEPSKVAKPLIASFYEGKMRVPTRSVLETVEVRLNGSIVRPKQPSRRDLRRQGGGR